VKNATFEVGSSSDPARYSKSLKTIENYIQRTYKMPDDIVKTIQNLTRQTFKYPDKPKKEDSLDSEGNVDKDLYEMEIFSWKEDWKVIRSKETKYLENEANAWALIWNQCSHELRTKLEGTSGFTASKSNNDVVSLLGMIRAYCCQFDALNDQYVAIVGAMKNLLYFFQKPNQTNSDYHEDFLAMVEVIEQYGGAGSLTHFPNMLKTEVTAAKNANGNTGKATEEEVATAKKIVKEKFLAALMLSGANRERYGELKRGMAENYMTGTSEYPVRPRNGAPYSECIRASLRMEQTRRTARGRR